MKRLILCLILASMATSLNSCACTHLWRWGLDRTSAVHEVKDERIAAFIKPYFTLALTPPAAVWDLVTLPYQLIFSVYPYGSRHMVPVQQQ